MPEEARPIPLQSPALAMINASTLGKAIKALVGSGYRCEVLPPQVWGGDVVLRLDGAAVEGPVLALNITNLRLSKLHLAAQDSDTRVLDELLTKLQPGL